MDCDAQGWANGSAEELAHVHRNQLLAKADEVLYEVSFQILILAKRASIVVVNQEESKELAPL
jgi:hypothetical protein